MSKRKRTGKGKRGGTGRGRVFLRIPREYKAEWELMNNISGDAKNKAYRYSIANALKLNGCTRAQWNNVWGSYCFANFEDETEKMRFFMQHNLEDGATRNAPKSQKNKYNLVKRVIQAMGGRKHLHPASSPVPVCTTTEEDEEDEKADDDGAHSKGESEAEADASQSDDNSDAGGHSDSAEGNEEAEPQVELDVGKQLQKLVSSCNAEELYNMFLQHEDSKEMLDSILSLARFDGT